MIILRYNADNEDLESVAATFTSIRKALSKEEEIICLPHDWDILFNCSESDLICIKEMIEKILTEKYKK